MKKKIVLISCVSKKMNYKIKAEKLYTSPLFERCLQYARNQNPDDIFILSAKHGLLELDREIEPYNTTLNNMPSNQIKIWADKVLKQLKERVDLKNDFFVFLAGEKYRRYLLKHLKSYEIPLQGMPIGKQLQYLKNHTHESVCHDLHQLFSSLPRLGFPFAASNIPKNGIYILFQRGEHAHKTDRIVRIGTHEGENKLCSRLTEHFIKENKDRSIFRKNIGRAILNKNKDPFLHQWEIDLTTAENRKKYAKQIDHQKLQSMEKKVSDYIRCNFSFVVFGVETVKERLRWESKIISTVSQCEECYPSENWLGLHSSKDKIRKSGLWLVNELNKQPLLADNYETLKAIVLDNSHTMPLKSKIVRLVLRRGPCYGTCPVYSVTVTMDGRVEWVGEYFVHTIGPASWTIPLSRFSRLEAAMDKLGFHSMRSKYTHPDVTDAPSCEIEVEFADGARKIIKHDHGDRSAPRTLLQLEDKIDAMLSTKPHIGLLECVDKGSASFA